jgi:hypothetical protein
MKLYLYKKPEVELEDVVPDDATDTLVTHTTDDSTDDITTTTADPSNLI